VTSECKQGRVRDHLVFTQPAQSHPFRIVLINGEQLAALMIRHNVGVRIDETLHLKKVDEDFFVDE